MEENEAAYQDDEKDYIQLPLSEATEELGHVVRRSSAIQLAGYIALWIALSSATIIFNKYILSTIGFHFPILLTAWHMAIATVITQILAHFTSLLRHSRENVSRENEAMTPKKYLRTIFPIGVLFSLCLMCGNLAYLYLTVSFIQMLKGLTPVVTVFVSWAMGITPLSLRTLAIVSCIVLGVIISSYGEVHFVALGVLIQFGGVVFDAMRLVLTQRLLTTSLDPLTLLYYFSPLCAIINLSIALFIEIPTISMADIQQVGYMTLLANGLVAFALNFATVLLIGKTTSVVMTLCGVLKNILIVLVSMIIFGDPVSHLQALGYSISLSGLVYFQLGAEQLRVDRIRSCMNNGLESLGNAKSKSPNLFRLAIGGLVLLFLTLLLLGLSWAAVVPLEYGSIALEVKPMRQALARTLRVV